MADLPLVVEACELEPLAADMAGMQRVTTHVRLVGAGCDGLGEDISPFADEHEDFRAAGPSLPLAGQWTLAGFCEHLFTLDPWPKPPVWATARRYRTWAFESAALDLALRQAGRSLHDVLGREPRPLRFVNSLGLGDPPALDTIHRRLERHPGLRLKVDADPAWSAALIAELAATGAVDVVDFKGHYGFPVTDVEALVALVDRILDAFPEAILEDPHDAPEVLERLAPHAARVSYDAPIHSSDDLGATALRARTFNVKPSRVGSLRTLLDVYARCEAHGLAMYGGGMGELGAGRGQIQLLAAMFHPDGPNDVAPSAFNLPEPPDGLPSSPLDPRPTATGFRRER